MKTTFFIIAFGLTSSLGVFGQSYKPPKVKLDKLPHMGLRAVTNTAFKAGEKISYRLHYGIMNAGIATLEVKETKTTYSDRPVYHLVGEGKTIGSFDWFFKVRDRYESYMDKEGMFPYHFIRNCDEGGYKIFQDYTFHPDKRAMVNHKKETYLTPDFVQDMLSAFYYARTMDLSQLKVGEIITVTTIVDDEVWPLKMKYLGKETIKVDAGKFRCMQFAPVVQKGRVFKKEEDMTIWITDDKNHVPILAKAKILVGSIKMEMMEYSGLANPVAKVD